jgi:hypothetical protein
MQKCAQKRLDRADIVRDVRFRPLIRHVDSPFPDVQTFLAGVLFGQANDENALVLAMQSRGADALLVWQEERQ